MDDELMTVEQAALRYDVSPLTLRRRAQYGEIEGAVRVRGRRGQEWRVPGAALEVLGYERRHEAALDLEDLLTVVRRLTETLGEAQQENARLNRELGGAMREAAQLRGELVAERRLSSLAPRPPHVLDLDGLERGSAWR